MRPTINTWFYLFSGGLGFCWFILFRFLAYESPDTHPTITKSEIKHIGEPWVVDKTDVVSSRLMKTEKFMSFVDMIKDLPVPVRVNHSHCQRKLMTRDAQRIIESLQTSTDNWSVTRHFHRFLKFLGERYFVQVPSGRSLWAGSQRIGPSTPFLYASLCISRTSCASILKRYSKIYWWIP